MNQTPLLLTPILILLILTSQTHSQKPHISPTQPPKPSPTSPSPTSSSTTLDPKQLKALESLDIPTKKDPCSNSKTIRCDNSKPFRKLLSLTLSKCSSDVSLSTTVLENLSTLQDLTFQNCSSVSPVAFPPALASNLRSFTCVDSLKKISGVWLSKFENVTDLTVTDVAIKASGPVIIVAHLKKLSKLTISRANLTGELPGKSWGSNVSHIDLSENHIKGKIPDSMTSLDKLISLDLSSNQLTGVLPDSIGDLAELKNLSLSKNSLSGPIPESISDLKALNTLDLSSNQFNGTIPKSLADLKGLKQLNLEKNNFQGVMPFNESFIKRLEVFKINDNDNLCYNHSTISSKLKLGIAKCDKNGFPVSAPAKSPSDDDYVEDDSSDDSTAEKSGGHKGPNKVVLGVAIALSSIVFLIIFLILLSRKCA